MLHVQHRDSGLHRTLSSSAAVGSPESGFPASCLAARGQPIRPAEAGSGGQGSQIDRFAKEFNKDIVRFGRLPRIRISSEPAPRGQPSQASQSESGGQGSQIARFDKEFNRKNASGDRSEFGFPASRQRGLWFVRLVVRKTQQNLSFLRLVVMELCKKPLVFEAGAEKTIGKP